jgi:hypothetical protein
MSGRWTFCQRGPSKGAGSGPRSIPCEYPPKPSAAATRKRSFNTDQRMVDLFKQAHGRAPASNCEAYQWAQEMDDVALTVLGFEGRDGFQYNYDLCLW